MHAVKPQPRVLAIDDEQIIADTLVQILKMHGYDARAQYSGEAAIEDAKEFHPQVVLSDVRMPKIDGIETALRIRKLQPTCRIILFTASPVRTETHQRISELCFEFLQRPLHPREVLAMLQDDSARRPQRSEELSGGATRVSAGLVDVRGLESEADQAAGNWMWNTAPWPGDESSRILPPCASIDHLAIASPKPAPPVSRVRDSSSL